MPSHTSEDLACSLLGRVAMRRTGRALYCLHRFDLIICRASIELEATDRHADNFASCLSLRIISETNNRLSDDIMIAIRIKSYLRLWDSALGISSSLLIFITYF